jgi:hypothetical protein
MVLPTITYNRSRIRRRINRNRPSVYAYEPMHVQSAREQRRSRTVRELPLSRSNRPPSERAARTAARQRAIQEARQSVYWNLANMNRRLQEKHLLRPEAIEAAKKILKAYKNKKSRSVLLSQNVKDAITNENLEPIVVEAWNKPGGEKYYMNPSTMKHFLGPTGIYTSPRTRATAGYMYRKAQFRRGGMITNKDEVLKKAMNISRNINKKRASMAQGSMIPNNRIGRPNTSGNASFARRLSRMFGF